LRKGLYRLVLKGVGDCARTSDWEGDAAPFLDRVTYEYLGFQPAFDSLPSKREYLEHVSTHHIPALRCEEAWSAERSAAPIDPSGLSLSGERTALTA
jgi:hypothetical protein